MKTIFVPCRATDLKVGKLDIEERHIGLVTTAQHIGALKPVAEKLRKNGKVVEIGKGRPPNDGQMLGCDTSAAKAIKDKVDCFLFIGTGRFHPLVVAADTEKPVYILDPCDGRLDKIGEIEVRASLKKRYARINSYMEAESVGVIVSTKPGQMNVQEAMGLRERLKRSGKAAFIFVANEINEYNFLGFDVNAYVNTACPRIEEDHFPKPIINSREIENAK